MKLVSNGPKKGIALELEVAFLNPNVETALRNRIFLEQSFNILQVPQIWIACPSRIFGILLNLLHISFGNPKVSSLNLEFNQEIKNRHRIIDSDASLKISSFLCGSFC